MNSEELTDFVQTIRTRRSEGGKFKQLKQTQAKARRVRKSRIMEQITITPEEAASLTKLTALGVELDDFQRLEIVKVWRNGKK